MPIGGTCPVVGFAAFSGTGKTTLLAKLIPRLKAMGFQTGAIKRSHHDIEVDEPGKDSHILRMAGATSVMLSTPFRRVVITEHDMTRERSLEEELAYFHTSGLDIIFCEGFKKDAIPKIELHRPSLGNSLLFPDDPNVIAIASDGEPAISPSIPLLDLNDADQIAHFIVGRFLRHG